MSAAALMLLAWTFEIVLSWPGWLYRRIGHPVGWFGALVSVCDGKLNRKGWSHQARYAAGVACTLACIGVAISIAIGLVFILPQTWWGYALEGLIASALIASRSLYAHVDAVARPLAGGDLEAARKAVSMIVGRNPDQLHETGVARAGLESLAENTSDGVIAPLFWGAIAGLPGLAGYKAINTLDSMIGHRNAEYAAFGGFAARVDDIANLVPARLTGLLISAASLKPSAFGVMLRDARHHRSPNAGWPEAAVAAGLGVRLSGPRFYGSHMSDEPWLNRDARDPDPTDMTRGLALYRRAMALAAISLAMVVAGSAI